MIVAATDSLSLRLQFQEIVHFEHLLCNSKYANKQILIVLNIQMSNLLTGFIPVKNVHSKSKSVFQKQMARWIFQLRLRSPPLAQVGAAVLVNAQIATS